MKKVSSPFFLSASLLITIAQDSFPDLRCCLVLFWRVAGKMQGTDCTVIWGQMGAGLFDEDRQTEPQLATVLMTERISFSGPSQPKPFFDGLFLGSLAAQLKLLFIGWQVGEPPIVQAAPAANGAPPLEQEAVVVVPPEQLAAAPVEQATKAGDGEERASPILRRLLPPPTTKPMPMPGRYPRHCDSARGIALAY